ncbi:MAG TPA: hypothetical protein VE995_01165 [Gaiellaceae bacterium]|nr:hypothetical protein [Gaiellaceae bacterium]
MRGGRAKELARRVEGGRQVSLLWRRADGRLSVVVKDATGRRVSLPARSDNALDVYYHPYAYGLDTPEAA